MFQLDLKSGASICEQIVNGFTRLKALGVIEGGEQLPSVRALASRFSVNPNTVQKAYAILESKGIIYSVKGKGNFMSDDETATTAVVEAAEDEFKLAVAKACELGLCKERLIEIIKQTEGI